MDHTVNTSCPETSGVTPPPFATSLISSCPSTPGNRNFGDILVGRTAKEHEKEYEDMRKENFSLKLRIFLLEQKISDTVGRDVSETIQENVQLRLTLDALQREVKCKERILEETAKVARDNEAAYRRAERKIAALQEEIDSLKEELESKEKFCTPQQSGSEAEVYKEAFDGWSQNQSASIRLSDAASVEELKKELAELQTEGIVKELENKQLNVLNKQKDETIEIMRLKIIKRSKVIQRLTDKLQSCPGSEDMLHAVNEGIKAAKRKDIKKVLDFVNQIKQKFSELVSMNSDDLFQQTFNADEIITSTAIKDKEHMQFSQFDRTEFSQYLDELHQESRGPEMSFNNTSALMFEDETRNEEKLSLPLGILEPDLTSLEDAIPERQKSTSAKANDSSNPKDISKKDKQRSIEELKFEVEMVRSLNKKLQDDITVLQLEIKSLREPAAKMKSPFVVTDSSTQTMCATIMNDNAWDNRATKVSQGDSVDKLKEEISVLLTKLEQKDKDSKSLTSELYSLKQQMQEVKNQKILVTKQFNLLQQHLTQHTAILNKLLQEKYRLSDVSFTPQLLEEASRFLNDTLEISRRLSGNLMALEQSFISHRDSTILSSTFNEAISRCSSPPKMQIHTIDEIIFEEEHDFPSRGGRDFCDFSLEGRQSTFSNNQPFNIFNEQPPFDSHLLKLCEISMAKAKSLSSDLGIGLLDSSGQLNPIPSRTEHTRSSLSKCADASNDNHAADISDGGHQRQVSSDSDIWSEPDRNLSNQRVGIEMTAPFPTPPRQRSKSVSSQHQGERAGSSSDGTNDSWKSDHHQKHKKALFQEEESVVNNSDGYFENQLIVIESFKKKVDDFQRIVENLAAKLNVVDLFKNLEITGAAEICVETESFKSILSNTLQDIRLIKDASVKTRQFTSSETVVRELKDHMENILKALSDKDEKNVTANQAKDIAEKALLELDVFKRQLLTVCAALMTDVNQQPDTIISVLLTPSDDVQSKGDISITDDIRHMSRLVSNQRTENIKLKQILSCMLKEKQLLENEVNRMTSCRTQPVANASTGQDMECQTDLGSQEHVKSICECLMHDCGAARERLLKLEEKCSELERKCDKIVKEKSNVSLENRELKENVQSLENRLAKFTDHSDTRSRYSHKLDNSDKSLADLEYKIRCLEDENTQYLKNLKQSEELCKSLKIQLASYQRKLEEMRMKFPQLESLELVGDNSSSVLRGDFRNDKEILKQRKSDCSDLIRRNSSMSASALKPNNSEAILENLISENASKDEVISSLQHVVKSLKKSLEDQEEILQNTELQFQSLQKSAFIFESDPYILDSMAKKEPSNFVEKIKTFQRLIHRANVLRNFINIVNSVIIKNLKKKLSSKDEDIKGMEFELLCYQKCLNTSGSINSAVMGDAARDSIFADPRKFSDFQAEFSSGQIAEGDEFDGALQIGDEVSFGLGDNASNSRSSQLQQLQLEHASAQKEILELNLRIKILEDQLIKNGCALNNLEKEKELLKKDIFDKETLTKSLENKLTSVQSEVDDLKAKMSQVQKENANLRSRFSNSLQEDKNTKQEIQTLKKQLKEKLEHAEKLEMEVDKFEKEKKYTENVCSKHSDLIEKFRIEIHEKNTLIDKLILKAGHVEQLENDVKERDHVLQEYDECLSLKSEDYNAVLLELKNTKDYVNKLSEDLKTKIEQEKFLEKKLDDWRKLLEERACVEDNMQKEMETKLILISNMQNILKTKVDLIEQLNVELQSAKSETDDLKSVVSERENTIQQLKLELDVSKSNLCKLQSNMQKNVKLVESLQQEMEKMKIAEAKSKADSHLLAKLEKLKDEVARKSDLLKSMNEELNAKNGSVINLQEQLRDQFHLVNGLKSDIAESRVFIEHLENEDAKNSEAIHCLQEKIHDKSEAIRKLESEAIEKENVISEYEADIQSKTITISQLERDLEKALELVNKVQSDNKMKSAKIRDLQTEVDIKSAMLEKSESERQNHMDALQNKIRNLEKEILSYTNRRSLAGKYGNIPRKSFRRNMGLELEPVAAYQLQAVLPAEKESSASLEKNQMKEASSDKKSARLSGGHGDTLDNNQLLKQLPEKNSAEECLQELKGKAKYSEFTSRKSISTNEFRKTENDNQSYWDACKWTLQKNILSLQAEIFKDNQKQLAEHVEFIKFVKDMHHAADDRKEEDRALSESKLIQLKLDVKFLENIRVLLRYFVIPLMNIALKNETGCDKPSGGNVTRASLEHKNKQTAMNCPEISEMHAKESADSGTDKESAVSSDNCVPVSGAESLASFSSYQDLHQHMLGTINHLSGDESKDMMQLRSNYSSPDLGIESDPNQEVLPCNVSEQAHQMRVSSVRSSAKSPSKRSDQPQYSSAKDYMKKMSLNGTSLFIVGMLKDFELLKKDIQECTVQIKSIASRAANGLETLSSNCTPKKLLEQSTLKGIRDSCNHVEVCLDQAESIANKFIIISWPMEEEYGYAVSLLVENQELKAKLTELRRKFELQEKEFQTLLDQLALERRKKEENDKIISKQLVRTKKILRQTKANLLGQPGAFGCKKPTL